MNVRRRKSELQSASSIRSLRKHMPGNIALIATMSCLKVNIWVPGLGMAALLSLLIITEASRDKHKNAHGKKRKSLLIYRSQKDTYGDSLFKYEGSLRSLYSQRSDVSAFLWGYD